MKFLLGGIGFGLGVAMWKNMPPLPNGVFTVWVFVFLLAVGAAAVIGYQMGGGGAHAEATAIANAEAEATAAAMAQNQVIVNVGDYRHEVEAADRESLYQVEHRGSRSFSSSDEKEPKRALEWREQPNLAGTWGGRLGAPGDRSDAIAAGEGIRGGGVPPDSSERSESIP